MLKAEVSPAGQRKNLLLAADLFSMAGCTRNHSLAPVCRRDPACVCTGPCGPRLGPGAHPRDPLGNALAAV